MNINQKINEIAVKFFNGNNSRFAEEMGTSEANIRNYRNKITPKVEFLVALCNKFEINFEWMLNDEGAMLRNEKNVSIVREAEASYGTNAQQTISDLRDMISAQKKTIEMMEALLANKSGTNRTEGLPDADPAPSK